MPIDPNFQFPAVPVDGQSYTYEDRTWLWHADKQTWDLVTVHEDTLETVSQLIELARAWAIKMNGEVEAGEGYSAKYYVQQVTDQMSQITWQIGETERLIAEFRALIPALDALDPLHWKLTGLSLASSDPVATSDSILAAFGKVQAQLNASIPLINAFSGRISALEAGLGNIVIDLATPTTDGLMSAADKAKLDGMDSAALDAALDELPGLVGDVSALQGMAAATTAALVTKADTVHTHGIADIAGLQTWQTGVQTALGQKLEHITGLISAGSNVTITGDGTLANPYVIRATASGDGGTGGAVTSVNTQTGDVVLGKAELGLGNVDNTSDANKPLSTAATTALALKAPLASPALTGTPTVPTAAAGTNTTQAASTAFVTTAVTDATAPLTAGLTAGLAAKADLASPTFTGDPRVPTAAAGDSDTTIASTAFVTNAITTAAATKANLASPTFTGDPRVPTAAAGDNDTTIANTAFVSAAITAAKVPGIGQASVASLWDLDTAALGTIRTFTGTYAQSLTNHAPEWPLSADALPDARPAGAIPLAAAGALSFRDEFDGTTLDTDRWITKEPWWGSDVGNLNNFEIKNGMLRIWVPQKPDGSFDPKNRAINTHGKFRQKHGVFEIEAKLPKGFGFWPAFWMYGYNHPAGLTPEIDGLEAYTGAEWETWWTSQTLRHHPINYAGTVWINDTQSEVGSAKLRDALLPDGVDLSADFHKYSFVWDAAGVQFFFDGQAIGPKIATPSTMNDVPLTLILDNKPGDVAPRDTAGIPTAATVASGLTDPTSANAFEIKYIRAWAHTAGTTVVDGPLATSGQAAGALVTDIKAQDDTVNWNVFTFGTATHTTQLAATIIEDGTSVQRIRHKSGSSWTSWSAMGSGGSSTTQLATTAFVAEGLGGKLNVATVNLPNGTDMDTVLTAGLYSIESNAMAATFLNLPSPTGGAVLVLPFYNGFASPDSRCTQVYVTSGGRTFTRAIGANTVGGWRELAPLDSPALTGTPTAPTAAAGTNTTQLATTAFVAALGSLKANLASPALTGTPTAPTAATTTSTTQLATTAFVQGRLSPVGVNANAVGGGAVNMNNAPVGGFWTVNGTELQGKSLNWPSLGVGDATAVYWNVHTHGVGGASARLTQVATQAFSTTGMVGRTFIRTKHDATWTPWAEVLRVTGNAVNRIEAASGATDVPAQISVVGATNQPAGIRIDAQHLGDVAFGSTADTGRTVLRVLNPISPKNVSDPEGWGMNPGAELQVYTTRDFISGGNASVYLKGVPNLSGVDNVSLTIQGSGAGVAIIPRIRCSDSFGVGASDASFSKGLAISGDTNTAVLTASATGAQGYAAIFRNNVASAPVTWIQSLAASGNNIFTVFCTEPSAIGRGQIIYDRPSNQVLYAATSDARLKSDAGTLASLWASIAAIKVRSFRWKEHGDEGRVQIGFFAQELVEHAPEAVVVGSDAGPEDPEFRAWHVDPAKLVPRLVSVIQEMQRRIEQLEAKLAS